MTQNYVTCSINFFDDVNSVLPSLVKHNREEDRCVKTKHALYPVSIFVVFKTDDENRYISKNRWLDVCAWGGPKMLNFGASKPGVKSPGIKDSFALDDSDFV